MTAYFDNSATTKPCPAAVKAVAHMLETDWGNPSSLHNLGINAAKELIAARKIIADSIGYPVDER